MEKRLSSILNLRVHCPASISQGSKKSSTSAKRESGYPSEGILLRRIMPTSIRLQQKKALHQEKKNDARKISPRENTKNWEGTLRGPENGTSTISEKYAYLVHWKR